MVRIISIVMAILTIVIVVLTIKAGYQVVRESIPVENHCLEEELTYYRIEGGLFSHRVDTKEENSDGSYYKCLRWEEEPSLGKAMLGQKQIMKEAGK